MDNIENGKKKFSGPLVYAILGVSLLIVAVAGSAYAYFAASATATTQIAGETLDVKLGITLEKVSTQATGALVPIYDGSVSGKTSQLADAATATRPCVDTQGYTVCQIYKITTTNTGGDSTSVNITVNLTGSTNLKWANMTSATVPSTTHAKTETAVASNVSLAATNGTNTQYIMVYINNTGSDQTTDDGAKTFGGTVTAAASSGSQVEAKF